MARRWLPTSRTFPSMNKPSEYVAGRVQALTAREWVYEYDHGKVWPSAWGLPPDGYIAVPDDFDPKFKTSNSGKAEDKARFRFRL